MKYLILLFVFLSCRGKESRKEDKIKLVLDTSIYAAVDTIYDDKFDIDNVEIGDTVYLGGISGGGTATVTIPTPKSHEIPLLIDTTKWSGLLIAYYTSNQLK